MQAPLVRLDVDATCPVHTMKKLLIPCLIASLAGCAAPPKATLNSDYQANDITSARETTVQRVCPITFAGIADERKADETLGMPYGTEIVAENVPQLIHNGFLKLPKTYYQVSNTAGAQSSIKLHLKKFYIDAQSVSHVSNIVMKLDVVDAQDGLLASTTLRGVDVSVNWTNSESAINNSFNLALKNLFEQANPFLKRECRV